MKDALKMVMKDLLSIIMSSIIVLSILIPTGIIDLLPEADALRIAILAPLIVALSYFLIDPVIINPLLNKFKRKRRKNRIQESLNNNDKE